MPRGVGWRVRWMRGSECGVALQRGGDLGVGGAVVDQAELPVGVGLVADGGDGLLEHLRGWVVDGGEHRDERSGGAEPGRRRRCRRGRCVRVNERRLHPHRPNNLILGRPQGSDVADGELQRRRLGRDDEPNLVAPGPPAFGGRQHLGPELAADPAPQRDRYRRAHGADQIAPVVGEQHRAAGEHDVVLQPQRVADGVAGGHRQRPPDDAVGMQQPGAMRRRGVDSRLERCEGHALARRSRRSLKPCGRGSQHR